MPLHTTRVKGVTYDNPDGSSRQLIISRLNASSRLVLERDYANLYDRNAVMVMTSNRQQIGFLDRDLAALVAPRLDRGDTIAVLVQGISGGSDGYYFGVQIALDL